MSWGSLQEGAEGSEFSSPTPPSTTAWSPLGSSLTMGPGGPSGPGEPGRPCSP
ncbi:unnamed protein product [Nyctereutes procyonoides]|uniref:(raccoon dog) hypothetical protein n=1 Tax=Nyctereutes procyonoides TaxID=34880 RepID=A0A811XYT8_NYCPR|nr:unnamed protein product [Nyctereutes procyonoides]